jgi:hypothetical protein
MAVRTAEKPKPGGPVLAEVAKPVPTGSPSPDAKAARPHRATGSTAGERLLALTLRLSLPYVACMPLFQGPPVLLADDGRPKSIGGVMLEWARYMPQVAATRRGVELASGEATLRFARRLARGEEVGCQTRVLDYCDVRFKQSLGLRA